MFFKFLFVILYFFFPNFREITKLDILKKIIVALFNPILTSGLVHPYHLDESISSFRVFFIFTVFSIEISGSKQCRS